jgi:hypothetical protein
VRGIGKDAAGPEPEEQVDAPQGGQDRVRRPGQEQRRGRGGGGGGRGDQEDQEEGEADGAAHLPGPPHPADDGGAQARDPGQRDVKPFKLVKKNTARQCCEFQSCGSGSGYECGSGSSISNKSGSRVLMTKN